MTITSPLIIAVLPGANLAVTEGMVYCLTQCCGASATGSGDGVACRKCYRALPDWMGWAGLLDDADLDSGLAWLYEQAGAVRPTYLADALVVARGL